MIEEPFHAKHASSGLKKPSDISTFIEEPEYYHSYTMKGV